MTFIEGFTKSVAAVNDYASFGTLPLVGSTTNPFLVGPWPMMINGFSSAPEFHVMFKTPNDLPAGTFTLRVWMASTGTGHVYIQPSWDAHDIDINPGNQTLAAESQTDVDIVTAGIVYEVDLVLVAGTAPTAGQLISMKIQFNSGVSLLDAPLIFLPRIIWES